MVQRIVIVGGGAAGLALASKLGRKFGKNPLIDISLIDKNTVHIWKPKLHEVAVGVIDQSIEGLQYRDHGLKNGYRYIRGAIEQCDLLDRPNGHIDCSGGKLRVVGVELGKHDNDVVVLPRGRHVVEVNLGSAA